MKRGIFTKAVIGAIVLTLCIGGAVNVILSNANWPANAHVSGGSNLQKIIGNGNVNTNVIVENDVVEKLEENYKKYSAICVSDKTNTSWKKVKIRKAELDIAEKEFRFEGKTFQLNKGKVGKTSVIKCYVAPIINKRNNKVRVANTTIYLEVKANENDLNKIVDVEVKNEDGITVKKLRTSVKELEERKIYTVKEEKDYGRYNIYISSEESIKMMYQVSVKDNSVLQQGITIMETNEDWSDRDLSR